MCQPPKLSYTTPAEYRTHFEQEYCQGPVSTIDGITVYFRKDDFDHCMYESSKRDGNKDYFSSTRAERMDWIKATLTHPNADLYVGWDRKRKRYDHNRRVAVVYEDFVVVISMSEAQSLRRVADFVTAYKADNSIAKIRRAPKWQK